jgi:hypothetical protein
MVDAGGAEKPPPGGIMSMIPGLPFNAVAPGVGLYQSNAVDP